MLTHRPGGTGALLPGGRASEGFQRSSTRQEGLASGQNPISLEYQIHPPTIDTLVTGMVSAKTLS